MKSLAVLLSASILCPSGALVVDPSVIAAIRHELRADDRLDDARARRLESIAFSALESFEALSSDKTLNIGWQLRAYLLTPNGIASGQDELAESQFDWAMRAFGSLRSIDALERARGAKLHRAMRDAASRHIALQTGLSDASRTAVANAVTARLDGDEPLVGNYFFPMRLYVSPECDGSGAEVVGAMLKRLEAEESLRSVGSTRIAQLASTESAVIADAARGGSTASAELKIERARGAVVDVWVAAARQAIAPCFMLPQPADGLPSHAALSAERSARRRAEALRVAAEAAVDPTTGEQVPPGDELKVTVRPPTPAELAEMSWSEAVRALLAEAGIRIQDGAVIVSAPR